MEIVSMMTVRNKSSEEKTKLCIQNAKCVHGNLYDYSKVKYINDKKKLCIICPIHGEFYQSYNDHVKSKHKCPYCNDKIYKLKESNQKRLNESKINFVKQMDILYNGFYNLSKFKYVNTNTKGEIICPIHGSFYKEPNKLINRKQACPKCNIKRSKFESITEEFLVNNNFDYTMNKENLFEDCKSKIGNYLDFDFYIPSLNLLIEIDGEQHFKPKFDKDINEFKRVRECDNIRNEWVLTHDIKLLRLSYKLTINELYKYLNQILIYNDFTINTNKVLIIDDIIDDKGYYS